MARPRGGKGHIELIKRKHRPSYWVLHYRVYDHYGNATQRRSFLGFLSEMSDRETVQAAVDQLIQSGKTLLDLRCQAVAKMDRPMRTGLAKNLLESRLTGRCEICGQKTKRSLCMDHNHATGENRGLLCVSCNAGIGMLGDDPAILRQAALYLEQHKAQEIERER